MPAAARSRVCSSVSAWLGVFASIAMSSVELASVPSASFLCQLEAVFSDF